ncbi:unnamed protein product [Cunninghamella echinulata]
MTTSASAMTTTTGLTLPQSYSKSTRPTVLTNVNSNNNEKMSTPSSPSFSSRLPQINNNNNSNNSNSSPSDNNSNNNNNNGSHIRTPQLRRQSVIGNIPVPNKSTIPLPNSNNNNNVNTTPTMNCRPVRQRTMSDASRIDTSSLPIRPSLARDRQRSDLRRSLYLEHDDSIKSMLSSIKHGNNNSNNNGINDILNNNENDDDDDDESTPQRYRISAPLLNAYGVPKMKTRASMGALKYSSTTSSSSFSPSSTSTPTQQQQQQQSTFSSSSSTSPPQLPPSDLNQKIRVCVRKRPLNKKELDKGEKDISPCFGNRTLQINEPKLRLDLTPYIDQHTFTFDDVFDWNTPNTRVYERTALPLVKYIFEGGKATCFAYGQTGSGKTFTMLDPEHGLYIMAANDIFSLLRKPEYEHLTAWIGLYEIYQGQLYDLLNERKKLFAREDGKQNVIISGLKEYPIDNVDKLIRVFDYGNQIRSTGSTGANDSSSRSHAVLQILLKPKKNKKKIHGKLSFIDLAGSERGADRGESDTKTRMEGAEINKSLLALKECIRALDQDKKHTPFRQSKLTQVLKDSFVGKSRTCMIATMSPNGSNSEHTLNTLRYADRVKELKGDRDKRAMLENSISSGSNGESDNIGYFNGDDEDDYINSLPDDSYDDSQDDSDIFDEDTYKLGEENIFDVDFPHEQDELIHSSTFSTTTVPHPVEQKPISPPGYSTISSPKTDHSMNRQSSSSSSSRYDMDDLSLSSTKYERWSQPPMSPSRTYTYKNNDSNISHHSMTRSSSGAIMTDGNTSPLVLSSLTNKHHRSPILTMDTSTATTNMDNNNNNNNSSPSRRIPTSPSSVTTPTSTSRLSFSSTATNPGQQQQYKNIISNSTLEYSDMEEFVKLHRAEIRAVTDYTKKESKLVATMSLHLSSNQDVSDDDENNSMSTAGQYKSNQQFLSYLQSLDDILEEKMASISALRDRINDTMTKMD